MSKCTVIHAQVGLRVSPPGWAPEGHSHGNAVSKLKKSRKDLKKNRETNRLLSKWFSSGFNDLHKMLLRYRSPENPLLFQHYFSYFSRILFDGALALENCKIRIAMRQEYDKEAWRSVAMSQGQLSALIRLTQQPLVYTVQMLSTSFLPQTTICNHSTSAFCDKK
jgi:hypothetical protein